MSAADEPTDLMRGAWRVGNDALPARRTFRGVAVPRTRAGVIATKGGLLDEGWIWASNLAVAEAALENWDEASRYNAEARRLNPPESARQAAAQHRDRWHKLPWRAATGRRRVVSIARCSTASAKDPGMLGRRMVALRSGSGGGPDLRGRYALRRGASNIERTRSALRKADYRVSFLTRVIAFYRDYVDFLMATGQVDRALEVADSSRGRVLAERLGVAAPRRGAASTFRKQAADNDQVFIFYWLSRASRWRGLSQPAASAVFRCRPAPRSNCWSSSTTRRILNTSSDPLATPNGPGDQLYTRIVAPLAAALPRSARLVIVPDSALHRLNFETLPVRNGATAHYWIEDVTIQIAPSLSTARSSKTYRRKPETVAGRQPDAARS